MQIIKAPIAEARTHCFTLQKTSHHRHRHPSLMMSRKSFAVHSKSQPKPLTASARQADFLKAKVCGIYSYHSPTIRDNIRYYIPRISHGVHGATWTNERNKWMNEFMYICMFVFMSVCVCVSVCMYVRTCVRRYMCTYVCMYVCMYICKYVCICVCQYVSVCVCQYLCMWVCVYVWMCECMCMCVRMHVRTCVCIYVTMHAYMIRVCEGTLMCCVLQVTPHACFHVQLNLTVTDCEMGDGHGAGRNQCRNGG
jgi:hypothetical protein